MAPGELSTNSVMSRSAVVEELRVFRDVIAKGWRDTATASIHRDEVPADLTWSAAHIFAIIIKLVTLRRSIRNIFWSFRWSVSCITT